MVWYSVRPLELLETEPELYDAVSEVVEQAQLHFHPAEQPTHQFVLRADTDDTNSVYIHVGAYTPHAAERFTVRLLRGHIGNGGAGVKPRGVAAGYQQGALTDEQSAVMARALDFMAEHSELMNALNAHLAQAAAALHAHPHAIQMGAAWDQFDPEDAEDALDAFQPNDMNNPHPHWHPVWDGFGPNAWQHAAMDLDSDDEDEIAAGPALAGQDEDAINNHPRLGA